MFEKNCIFHKRKGGISNQLNEPKRKKLENPINVADYATLSSIGKKLPLNAAYLQTNNIIVPAGIFHQPIASTAAPFTGHYNGNGFKIINLCSQGERLALFDTVENALIERVKLDNAIFIGHGKKIKIAPFIIEAKGNSQIKHLNWLSGYIEILGNELDEGEVAGLIHTVAKSVLLTSAQSSGELVRHHLIPKKNKKRISLAAITCIRVGNK